MNARQTEVSIIHVELKIVSSESTWMELSHFFTGGHTNRHQHIHQQQSTQRSTSMIDVDIDTDTVTMRAALVTSAAACAAAFQVSNAFTHSPTTSLVVKHRSFYKALPDALFVHPSDDAESTPQQQQFIHEIINEPTPTPSSASSLHQRLRYAGKQIWERMDTMKAAGLCDNGMEPLQSGFKTNVGLLVAAFLFKWYRARFINKVCCVSKHQHELSCPSYPLHNNSHY